MLNQLQATVQLLQSGRATVGEVRRLLHHRSPVVRATALIALVSHAQHQGELLGEFREAATAPDNQFRLMGTISVAHVAVACLKRIGSDRAAAIVKEMVASWPEPDRSDLLWFLKSDGLSSDDFKFEHRLSNSPHSPDRPSGPGTPPPE